MNLDNIVSVLIGAGVTWLAAWLYYKKAGDKLKQETTKLHRLTNLVLHGLENAGIIKLVKDASGEPTGIIIEACATATGEGGGSSTGEVIRRKSPNRDVTEASALNSGKNSG